MGVPQQSLALSYPDGTKRTVSFQVPPTFYGHHIEDRAIVFHVNDLAPIAFSGNIVIVGSRSLGVLTGTKPHNYFAVQIMPEAPTIARPREAAVAQ